MIKPRTKENLPVERPLRLYVNDTELVTLMATPSDLEELTYGWLWSNELISSVADVRDLVIDTDRALIWAKVAAEVPENLSRTISSGCGGGALIGDWLERLPKIDSDFKISRDCLGRLFTQFLRQAPLYRKSGGVHGAALASADEIIYVTEDIGRHNAVDKVIGWSVIHQVGLADKLILTTGRISSEMLAKAARAGLAIVGSRTAATDLAVKLAEAAGVGLAGYIRAGNALIYAHLERFEDITGA